MFLGIVPRVRPTFKMFFFQNHDFVSGIALTKSLTKTISPPHLNCPHLKTALPWMFFSHFQVTISATPPLFLLSTSSIAAPRRSRRLQPKMPQMASPSGLTMGHRSLKIARLPPIMSTRSQALPEKSIKLPDGPSSPWFYFSFSFLRFRGALYRGFTPLKSLPKTTVPRFQVCAPSPIGTQSHFQIEHTI